MAHVRGRMSGMGPEGLKGGMSGMGLKGGMGLEGLKGRDGRSKGLKGRMDAVPRLTKRFCLFVFSTFYLDCVRWMFYHLLVLS